MLIVSPASFTTWATLDLLVAEHVNECPSFMLSDQAKRAARQFFTRSGIWRSPEVALLTTVADQQSYAFTPETNAQLARVYSAWLGEDEIEVAQSGEWSDAPAATTEGDTTATKIEARADNKLWLSPMPTTADDEVRGTVVYTPTTAGAGIPSHAFEEWGPAIAAGAAAWLVAQHNRQWSNPNAAPYLRAMFNEAIDEASNQAGAVRRTPIRVKTW